MDTDRPFRQCVRLQRFGRIVQLYVTGIMLVTMGTALTVEYTTVGSLFSLIIPSTAIPIVIIIGVVSSVYTAYGGLHVSIITDQVQVTCLRSQPKASAASIPTPSHYCTFYRGNVNTVKTSMPSIA